MRNEWSLTLSGERTPRFTQPARGMFLRRSKVWRNGRDGSYRWWRSWTSMISDHIYPTKKGVELEIESSLGRNFPSNDYVIAPAGAPGLFRTVSALQAIDLVRNWISTLHFGSTAPRTHRRDQLSVNLLLHRQRYPPTNLDLKAMQFKV